MGCRPSKQEAILKLQRAIEQIGLDIWQCSDDQQFNKWRRDTALAVAFVFGEQSKEAGEFSLISYAARFSFGDGDSDYYCSEFRRGLENAKTLLQSMVDQITEYWSDDLVQSVIALPVVSSSSRRVFVVHGHDEAATQSVARYLEKLDLEPIILRERANGGQTIIEKFETHCDVDYAVVIMTPDDMAYCASDAPETARPRARQNVVFELGYFASKLGRSKVCALHKGDVEILSDYQGVLYVPMDSDGGWRLRLATEMKQAGIDIDMNKAI